MLGSLADAAPPFAERQTACTRSGVALAIALGMGAAALASPPLALLCLGGLSARVLMGGARLDLAALAGPAIVALMVGAFFGLAHAIGALFVWRLFADARWSMREAQRLAAAAGRPCEADPRTLIPVWLTPLYGLMLVAYTAPHMVAGLPLDLPHAPLWLVLASAALAAGAAFDWGLRRAADWRLGELAAAPAAHLMAHHIVFALAFGLMLDVSAGIVMLIAWRLAHAARLGRPQPSFTAVP